MPVAGAVAFVALRVAVDRSEEAAGVAPPPGAVAEGRQVFASAGCGACHTLADAGASVQMRARPRRAAQPSAGLVVQRVTNGQGAMPSFAGRLSEDEIAAVAAYVSSAAG